ncbi:MAG: MFS transporter [Pseudomonadota bacterium]
MPQTTNVPLILALWAAGLGAAGQYAKISVVFDRLGEAYPEAGLALGFVVSLVGFVGILFGVVAGLVVARIRYRRALLWALWVGAGVSLIQAVLPPLPVMLALRGVEGLSHLAIVVAAPTLIASLSAPEHRGLTLTLWSTFFGVTFTLIVLLGLPLVRAFGLPALFLAHSFWMTAAALLLTRMLPRSQPATDSIAPSSLIAAHIAIYRSPRIAAPAAGWLFYTFCFLAILTVLPPHIAPEWRTWTVGAMPLISIMVSMSFGVMALRYVSPIALVQVGFFGCIAALIWLLVAPGSPAACFALAAALGLIQGASFAAVPDLNPDPADQAKANGALAQMGNLGNTLGTPALLAVLSVAGYAGMVWTAILVFACGIGVHALLAARR